MQKKGNKYGVHRVIEPKGLMTQAAKKIDNTMECYSNEILCDVSALNIDSASFTQIYEACGKDLGKTEQMILDIVNERGKMQNPVTGSGGMFIGTVKEIGEDLQGKIDLKVGDKIASLVSLSLTPLKIGKIKAIHPEIDRVEVEAQAILFESGLYAKLPDDMSEELALAGQYPFVYAALGIHPESIIEEDTSTRLVFGGDWRAELRAIRPLYEHPKAVAVGECGLDYHWPIPKEEQQALFEEEIRCALELEKPILVHDREAHADVYALLKKYKPKGVLHCYSGSAEDAVWLARQGMYIGFGGTLTFKNARKTREAAAALPMEAIVLETDCPYMAPEPHRGQRNDSSLIIHVAEVLGQIKGLPVQEVLRATSENAKRLFGI